VAGRGSARRSCTSTQSLRRREVQTDSEEAGHQESHSQEGHSQEGDREQREVGTTQVGGGEDTGVACQVPQAHDPLRAARRHPRGVSASGLFSYLPQLPDMTVLKGSLNSSLALKPYASASEVSGQPELRRRGKVRGSRLLRISMTKDKRKGRDAAPARFALFSCACPRKRPPRPPNPRL
jgi:hypothetical protein